MDTPVLIARLVLLGIYAAFFWGIYSYERENGRSATRALWSAAAGAAVFTVLVLIGMGVQGD